MKVVSTEALTKLIQLVKSAFIKVENVVQTQEVTLATVATSGDYNDLTNKPTAGTGIDITNDVISVEGVKDQRNTSTAIKTWTGTKAQYDAITTKDNNTLYHITDDESSITTALNTLVQTTQTAITAVINSIYPVGSIYLTVSNDNPATLLGLGTWQKVASGRVLQGADTNHTAGTTIAAGLPNITGETYSTNSSASSHYANTYRGVFRGRNTTGYSYYGGNPISSSDTNVGISFDASRSNSIYGASSTVQPPAFVVNIWQRIS